MNAQCPSLERYAVFSSSRLCEQNELGKQSRVHIENLSPSDLQECELSINYMNVETIDNFFDIRLCHAIS